MEAETTSGFVAIFLFEEGVQIMATKKAPPRRNTDVIRCENCGEEYSTTYKRCPFCDERPGGQGRAPVGGRRVSGAAGAAGPIPCRSPDW